MSRHSGSALHKKACPMSCNQSRSESKICRDERAWAVAVFDRLKSA